MKELIKLKPKYDYYDSYPEDTARMKRVLKDRGFDANDDLIVWAWRYWSASERCCGWYSIDRMLDEWIADKLLNVLEPATRERGHEPKSVTPEEEVSVT